MRGYAGWPMEEAKLLERLRLIEALFAGATTDGERIAAGEAKRRVQARLDEAKKVDPPVEFRFTVADAWSRRLFMALLRRYELHPYRYRGQRRTTVMVRVPKRFVDETLWPQYEELSRELRTYLDEVTNRVVGEVMQADGSDTTEEIQGTLALGPGPQELGV